MWEVTTVIDPDLCSPVLEDHVVHGTALLPLSLQLELVVLALHGQGVAGDLTLRDIGLAEPILLRQHQPTPITVSGGGSPDGLPGRITVRSGAGLRHLTLELTRGAASQQADPPAPRRPKLSGHAGLIYPPMFHGPTFQVVERFGRVGDGLEVLGRDLPAWDVPERGAGRLAQLVELLFQSCGVLELIDSGRMMRPARVDRLALTGTHVGAAVRARVRPGPGRGFDGEVVDASGRVLVAMQGYRPVAFGSPADPQLAARLAAHVGRRLAPVTRPDKRTPVLTRGAAL